MRIIRGKYKGRTFSPSKNFPARPTTDYAKESLFNILENTIDLDSKKVLDLFAGSGNISFEFASRGAEKVTSIEQNHQCFTFIKKTIQQFDTQNIRLLKQDVFTFLKKNKMPFDIIFADPPYNLKNIADIANIVFKNNVLTNDGLLIIEHGKETDLSTVEYYQETRTYGHVNFSFFKKTST